MNEDKSPYERISMEDLLDSVTDKSQKRADAKAAKQALKDQEALEQAAYTKAEQDIRDIQELEKQESIARQERLYGVALELLSPKQRRRILEKVYADEEARGIRQDAKALTIADYCMRGFKVAVGLAAVTAITCCTLMPTKPTTSQKRVENVAERPLLTEEPFVQPIISIEPDALKQRPATQGFWMSAFKADPYVKKEKKNIFR